MILCAEPGGRSEAVAQQLLVMQLYIFSQKVQIHSAFSIRSENRLASVAPLRHMMRNSYGCNMS